MALTLAVRRYAFAPTPCRAYVPHMQNDVRPDPPDELPNEPADGPVYFDAVLRPNRSLSPRGFFWLMATFGTACFVTGIGFVTAGAWPVVGFFGLDVLILYIAFRTSYRTGNLAESIRLTERDLRVRRIFPSGRAREWRFQPYWLQVTIDTPPEHDSQLILSSHGKSLTIGSFLTPEERVEVADALRTALGRQGRGLPA